MRNIKSITFSPAELSMIVRAMLNPNYNLKVSDKDENRLRILARKFEEVLGPWSRTYRLTWEEKKPN
jgi:hypothetical protein